MATNWTIPTVRDLFLVLSQKQVNDANENTEATSNVDDELDYTGKTRASDLVTAAVDLCRASIQNSGAFPLSVTTGAVPPEAKHHVLSWAAYKLISGKPSLVAALMTEKGEMPLAKDYKEACDYFAALVDVTSKVGIVLPTDPTGQDYLTAISSSNPAINIISWGDQYATDEEYAAGTKTISSGYTVPVAPLDLNTYI